jgi:hypothetical protein
MHEELLQELETHYEMNRSIYEQLELWNDTFADYQQFEVDRSRSMLHLNGALARLERRQ